MANCGCTGRGPDSDVKADGGSQEESQGLAKSYTRGPVSVRVTVDRKEITIADRLKLSIQAEHSEEYEIELPKFGEKLDQFGIVDYETLPPKLIGKDKILVEKAYVLEPFLSGDYKIPPMKVQFWKKGEEDSGKHEIETEELSITVGSLLPEDISEMADIAPPKSLPRGPLSRLWPMVPAFCVLVLAVVAVAVRARRRSSTLAEAARIQAHELAFRELEKLIAEDLIGSGEIKLFFFRISDILRHYIENRFGLHAPERTTEEFLAELGSSSLVGAAEALRPQHGELLCRFLTLCDLVKFAEHAPGTEEVQQVFDTCKGFILETQRTEEAA